MRCKISTPIQIHILISKLSPLKTLGIHLKNPFQRFSKNRLCWR